MLSGDAFRDCETTQRVTTRWTRPIRTAMSGLSSGTASCGGEGARFRGGGEGERCLKKLKMVVFFFFFFFCGNGFFAVASGISTSISSSVGGAEEREESESAMVAVVCGLVLVVVVGLRLRDQVDEERNYERSTVRHA
jgi:hypothetical protein